MERLLSTHKSDGFFTFETYLKGKLQLCFQNWTACGVLVAVAVVIWRDSSPQMRLL
jgi:hypothetical protein